MIRCIASQRGFTLIELSVVLVIIAIVLGGGMQIFLTYLQSTAVNATVSKMDIVEKALLDYAIANNRIPCPSSLTIAQGATNYGVEAATPGTCYGGTPAANFQAASGTVEGGIPTRTLRLTDDFMYDAWGRRLRYAVDPAYTVSNSLPASVHSLCSVTSASAITVNDASGNPRTTAGMYAIVSHGANGHGGYTSNGTVMNAGSVNANEQTNCHCNASATATTYSPTYVEKYPTIDSSNALDNFDDIVTFKEPWQIQALNYPLTAASCQTVYVAGGANANCTVQYFTTTGVYLGQFGSCGTSPGQFIMPSGIAIDKKGNLWVTDYGNDTVQEFNSSGSYISGFGCCAGGSATGDREFNEADGIAIDSSGNIWVSDKDNNRLQKFNTSGTWLMTIGGDKGDGTHTCTQCSSNTSCTCYSGTGNGQFNVIQGNPVIDSSGNIWVNDAGNGRLQEFNSSGSWLNTLFNGSGNQWQTGFVFDSGSNLWWPYFGYAVEKFNSSGSDTGIHLDEGDPGCCEGSANGRNYGGVELAIDSNGNFWITDPYNNRVQEFNSSGNWLRSIGGPPPYTCETSPSSSEPACPQGSANGQFNFQVWGGGNYIAAIAISSR